MASTLLAIRQASASRLGKTELNRQMHYFRDLPLFSRVFHAIDAMVMVLNDCRQVIFANKPFLDWVGFESVDQVLGQRPGEVIGCPRAKNDSGGCGTAEACQYCKTLDITLAAMTAGKEISGEVVVLCGEQSRQLSIHVAPFQGEAAEEILYMVTLADISNLVRKRALERIFFHDVLNTTGALKGIIGLLREDVSDAVKAEIEFVESSFRNLIEEIQAQKLLVEAENNELSLNMQQLDSLTVLLSLTKLYEGHVVAKNKTIKIAADFEKIYFSSDLTLLNRVLSNMLKNALEATEENGQVTIGCCREMSSKLVCFWIHNDEYIDKTGQFSLFQPAVVSAKGSGRGLGTYAMRLLGEKYLGGVVGFSSSEAAGTEFYIQLPLKW
ncbi:MAG: ATP-binding protein [Negativicutes bacterium]|nr:ATP-binding protein [Negativicutes bacterium]